MKADENTKRCFTLKKFIEYKKIWKTNLKKPIDTSMGTLAIYHWNMAVAFQIVIYIQCILFQTNKIYKNI